MDNSKIEKKRIWTLGHFNIGLQVNPHYFGNIKLKEKNNKTKFFLISTKGRNYNYIISSAKKLTNEKLKFEIFVVGHDKTFSIDSNNTQLNNIFIFNYNVNYSTLYKIVYNSDYIIVNLDPDRDQTFKTQRVSGAVQLSYGFLKPVLINNYFKETYNMTEDNSFVFDKKNFYNVMRQAILLSNENYNLKRLNLMKLAKDIYDISKFNVQITLNSLLIEIK